MNCTCGCCEGVVPVTPVRVANRPGLDAVEYRVGTHAHFLESMRARISGSLRSLSTRDPDDPSLALLDAWATVADVLSFYQERIANEGYLRTATERRSILELGRLVGYRLGPGVAATAYLAYGLEADAKVTIDVGSAVQSVPGPAELPQTFETVEPLEARGEWNSLGVRQTKALDIPALAALSGNSSDQIYLRGITTGLGPGDPLLIDFGPAQELYRVIAVQPDADADRTLVVVRPWRGTSVPTAPPAPARARAIVDDRPTLEELVEEVTVRYADVAAAGVPPTSVIAGRVVALLEQLRTDVMLGMRDAELREFLERDVLPMLRRQRGLAQRSRPLRAWLGGLIGELSELAGRAEELGPLRAEESGTGAVPAPAAAPPAPAPDSVQAAPATTTIGDVVDSLAKPASEPPPNALRLTPDIDELFGAGSDVVAALLTRFRPDVAQTLYQAWRNVPATPAATLRVYALRTRASAFGHDAPPEPVKNSQGVVAGTREWTLYKPAGEGVPEEFECLIVLPLGPRQPLHPRTGTIRIRIRIGAASRELSVPVEDLLAGPVTVDMPAAGEQVLFTFVQTGDSPGTERAQLRVDLVNRTAAFETVVDQSGGIEDAGRQMRLTWSSDGADPTEVRYALGSSTESTSPFEGDVDSRLAIRITINGQLRNPAGRVPTEQPDVVSLDTTYPGVVPDGWAVIERPERAGSPPPDAVLIRRVEGVREATRDDYGITGKSTFVKLDQPWLDLDRDTFAVIRGSAVFVQSEELELAEVALDPVAVPICGAEIPLDRLYDGLEPGRWLVVSGERVDVTGEAAAAGGAVTGSVRVPGVPAAELVMLGGVRQTYDPQEAGATTRSTLILATPLAYCYRRDTVVVHGNVVKATHGATQHDVLGSGDTSRPNQSFPLQTKPLTYVSAATPTGVESTLQVYVDNVRWHEADGPVGLGPADRSWVARTDDDDTTTVTFGNGMEGARLPTGQENVTATYRTGLGRAGNVQAGQLSLLSTRPQGVLTVINPLPAAGGADREDRDQARANIPLAVTALDRIVTVQDYADFARTFAGISKASATPLTDGRRRLVHLTIAGNDDIPITPSSDLYRNLREALRRFGDPAQAVQVDVRRLRLLIVAAKVRLNADYRWETVAPMIRAALADRFGFRRRELGQDVARSEVLAAVQAVTGVDYVDLDILDAVDEDQVRQELIEPAPGGLAAALGLQRRLRAYLARREKEPPPPHIVPAELICLDPTRPETVLLEVLQ
jgi:hypothetical protein